MFYRFVRQFITPFIDLRKIISVIYIPKFFIEWIKYRHSDKKNTVYLHDLWPCLNDRVKKTPFDPHYFYQASWLARRLSNSRPNKHYDIGSDVTMIGVISGFLPVEFVDFRPLNVSLQNLTSTSGNITNISYMNDSLLSLSCLHVVEHIGLGRYGEHLDSEGSKKALLELQRVVAPGGRLYLSVPIGLERVCFNAHRIFNPQTIIDTLEQLKLLEFSLIDDDGNFIENGSQNLSRNLDYGCGLFVFEKQINNNL